MNNTQSVYVHSLTALPKEYANLLKEGSSVLVRVLKQTGNNTYITSFAGGRFSVSSKEALKPGMTFMAKISFADGKLNLIKSNNSLNQQQSNNQNIIHQFNSMSPELSQMIMSLGLPADGISKMLIQTLVNLGAKFNLEKINRARNAALSFEGQEDEAAEAALILIEKGIEPEPENIRKVLEGFLKEKLGFKKFSIEKKENGKTEIDEKQIEEEIRNFFLGIFGQQGQLKAENGDCDFLTLFNHRNSREENHFVVIPFDFGFEKESGPVRGDGVFRVVFDLKKKNIVKSKITFNLLDKIWEFVVFFKGEQIKNVKFCRFPEIQSEQRVLLEQQLKMLLNVGVETVPLDEITGFASGETAISLVKGFA